MRIEKVSDNQIRCYLSKEDMESRNLHLKELAYGTEKARALFHELMREAREKYGFEAESMPVMIEAVPLQDNSLVLIVTRVDNPEELDTRFSSFSPSVKSGSSETSPGSSPLGQLLDEIRQEHNSEGNKSAGKKNEKDKNGRAPVRSAKPSVTPAPGILLYTFPTLGETAAAAAAVAGFRGSSSLYRGRADSLYYLFLSPDVTDGTSEAMSALSALSEFGTAVKISPAREQFLREHCDEICAENAIHKLSGLILE